LNIDYWGGKAGKNVKKTHKKLKNVSLFEQKAKKLKKRRKSDSFYCVFFVKIAHWIQKPPLMLKIGKVEQASLGASEWLTYWMLKWVR